MWLVSVVSRSVWVESMGVVSRRWVWLVGVVVRRHIDFLILLIPTFCSLKKCFSFLVWYFFVIKF